MSMSGGLPVRAAVLRCRGAKHCPALKKTHVSAWYFRTTETSFMENQEKTYVKTLSFTDLSSRKHYPGIHSLTIVVNGTEKGKLDFEVLIT